jgi:hypothetical protein
VGDEVDRLVRALADEVVLAAFQVDAHPAAIFEGEVFEGDVGGGFIA